MALATVVECSPVDWTKLTETIQAVYTANPTKTFFSCTIIKRDTQPTKWVAYLTYT